MKKLEEYVSLFGVKPPKLMMIGYEHEIYQDLMEEAISRNKPLTGDEVETAFEDVKVDVVR